MLRINRIHSISSYEAIPGRIPAFSLPFRGILLKAIAGQSLARPETLRNDVQKRQAKENFFSVAFFVFNLSTSSRLVERSGGCGLVYNSGNERKRGFGSINRGSVL